MTAVASLKTASPSRIEKSFRFTLTPPDSSTEKSAAGSVGESIAPISNATARGITPSGENIAIVPPAIIEVRNTPSVASNNTDLIDDCVSRIFIVSPA